MGAINHGKLSFKPVVINGTTYGQAVTASGKDWQEYASAKPGVFFIAVEPDGYICSAETQPYATMIAGPDIWEIEHEGPSEAIRGRRWDGEKVV